MENVSFYRNFNPEWNTHYVAAKDEVNSIRIFHDSDVALLLNLNEDDYQEILLNRFNGYRKNRYFKEIFFIDHRDAERALEWVNSIYLSVILTGSV